MIRPLDDEKRMLLAKARLDEPLKLLREWLFGWDNIAEDFEYLFDIRDENWRVVAIKIFFSIPIYFIVGIYKIVDFCLAPFEWDEYINRCFEFICCLLILSVFGAIRLPFAIYTYVRFNRATALIYMLKSD